MRITHSDIVRVTYYGVKEKTRGAGSPDKRAMREADLLAFEIGVKQGKPGK